MAFFDKLGETLSNKSKEVAQKAKDFSEINSLNGQISSQEELIKNTYFQIGKAYYERHKNEEGDPFAQQLKVVSGAEQKIAELRESIRLIKGVAVCEKCGAEVPAGSAFCASCGAKIESDVKPQEPQNANTCPNCGAALAEGAQFCVSCGHKVGE
jgi:ribosomal protein L40E